MEDWPGLEECTTGLPLRSSKGISNSSTIKIKDFFSECFYEDFTAQTQSYKLTEGVHYQNGLNFPCYSIMATLQCHSEHVNVLCKAVQ